MPTKISRLTALSFSVLLPLLGSSSLATGEETRFFPPDGSMPQNKTMIITLTPGADATAYMLPEDFIKEILIKLNCVNKVLAFDASGNITCK